MILYLGDCREGNLYDLSVGALNLNAGSREGLGGFHAANCAADAPAVSGDDFHVVLAIQGLQGCERFCYLHVNFLRLKYASYASGSLPDHASATGKQDLAYRNLSVYSSHNAKQVSAYDAEL
jgi:hypothetical protein